MGRFSKGTNTVGRSYVKQDPVTGGIRLPRGTTGERPTDNTTGTLRFNSTDNRVEYYDGSNFKQFRDYDDGELTEEEILEIQEEYRRRRLIESLIGPVVSTVFHVILIIILELYVVVYKIIAILNNNS